MFCADTNFLSGKGAHPSHAVKITIPPSNRSQTLQAKQMPAARVQPVRAHRSNRLADIMANIEDDDESRTAVPRRKKRPIIESDPDDAFNVPEEIENNPMAPAAKKRKQVNVPPRLPLQPTSPAQVPPKFQTKSKGRPIPRSQFLPQPQSTMELPPQPQESQPQYLPTANMSGPYGQKVRDEDDPMLDDYENCRLVFFLFKKFTTQTQIHYRQQYLRDA
jgi:hypothetical protein